MRCLGDCVASGRLEVLALHKSAFAAPCRKALSRLFFVVGCALTVLLASSAAFAAGRVEWSSKTYKERTDSKSWRVELKIFLPKAPDVAYVPMKFEFMPVAYYERNLVDGKEGPQERTVPLSNQQPLFVSQDVGFMDSSGTTQNRTMFTFKLTRAFGFEAGEYKVTIKDTRNDSTIGTPTTLKFEGENEIIDRRAIVFTGDKKKQVKKTPEEEKKPEEAAPPSDTPGADAADAEPSTAPEPTDEGQTPPSIEEKPGGCGCHQAPSSGGAAALWALSLGLLAAFVVRRRTGLGA